jgi:Type VI secretion system, TssN
MAINSFLIYIGAFLASAIALVLVVKNFAQGFAVNAKKPVLEGGLSALVASWVAYLTMVFTEHLFSVFWIFAGIFMLLGIIQVVFFHKKYFYSTNQHNKSRVVLGEILFMLAVLFFIVVVFSSLVYFLKKDKDYLFFPMLMSMLAFFIPLSVYYTFDAAFNIPPSVFPLWQYPLGNPIELPDEKPNEKLLVIAFELCKKTTDKATTNFRAKGPETMKLGDLFYHFINDYNEIQSETTIQYADNDYSPHEWGFRIKPKWYQLQRILDPELTVRENRIMENSVIICERI